MYCVKKITSDLTWLGGSDRRISMFENVFPVPHGISYNSYLVSDDKTVLLDTVDKAISEQFFENLAFALASKPLDYVIINHVEPDHCATLGELILRYPEVKIVGNTKTIAMLHQFFEFEIDSRAILVTENDVLKTGRHQFTFFMAPMVHWPEVMVTYDSMDKSLFSADAFGTFGALGGNLFADELDFAAEWLPDARSYYANIVGKYGVQVAALLKKISALDIAFLCPLHGPVWRENIDWFIEKYTRWSSYTPEEHTVMIAYASVYGNTENAVNILAGKLAEGGVRNIKLYDVSAVHPSVIVSEAFRCSHLVFASTTYNGGIFCNMETVLRDLKSHGLQNRTVALLQNGSWAATSGALMRAVFDSMKDIRVLNAPVSIKSSVKAAQLTEISALSKAILTSLRSPALAPVQPACDETTPHGYICKICGYRYEGDVLPADFICPICKHGAADFERF